MGTVQLTLQEWQELVAKRQEAEERSLELQKKLDESAVCDSDGNTKHLLKALNAAREVIRFAVANYPPEAVKGWPTEELKLFADLMETAPAATQDYREMAISLREFVRDAKEIEEFRKRRAENKDALLKFQFDANETRNETRNKVDPYSVEELEIK